MDILSAVVTLFLIMDPLGNIPLFLSTLKTVDPARRRLVLLHEIGIARVIQALERTGWNQTRPATLLGLNRDQIHYRREKFKLEKTSSS